MRTGHHGYWPPWVLPTMGTAHHGVTLAIMGHIIVTMGDIKWMGRLTAANSMYDSANYKGTSSLAACISSVSTNFCSELPLSCEMPQICCIFAAMSVSFSVFCIYLPPPWLLGISLSQHTIKFMVLSVLQGLTVLCSMTWVLATMGTGHHGYCPPWRDIGYYATYYCYHMGVGLSTLC